ncbi:MAG: 23S rRNA (adenine(2503)-C(2))-methyltransferase RlmN [Armatimonadetes bacterium]|nr:23S rRNA (adenine(2503)-C(2))-methyltransferase RlmN [Armatimonadota bacterium]MDW8027418.1 23S rRNA (adenine(2503)-C(2))-methyltransferase RlmN [Armatimonadota bacterium]
MTEKKILVGMTTQELESFAEQMGEPRYRGRQIAAWIYRKGVINFDAMTDLPKGMREKLSQIAIINPLEVVDVKVSSDGTTKYLSKLIDGETVECVFIPHGDWDTICVSTQVGCPIGCRFCASGESYARNLSAGEIVGQVLIAKRRDNPNIVFMGMGEPMLNFDNLVKAIKLLNKEVGIGARRMTVSTVGVVQGIRRLAQLEIQVNLAVSLHAPNDELRRKLIPAKLPPISEIMKACWDYFQATKRRITFEYVLLKGINDKIEHAIELSRLLKGLPCHVNLIPYNPTVEEFERPSENAIEKFRQTLAKQGIPVTVRHEHGIEIQGACGQLRRQYLTVSERQ